MNVVSKCSKTAIRHKIHGDAIRVNYRLKNSIYKIIKDWTKQTMPNMLSIIDLTKKIHCGLKCDKCSSTKMKIFETNVICFV